MSTSKLYWKPRNVRGLRDTVRELEIQLPGWWWYLSACSVGCGASCGPHRDGQDADLLCDAGLQQVEGFYDGQFNCDEAGTLTSALRNVMQVGLQARAEARERIPAASRLSRLPNVLRQRPEPEFAGRHARLPACLR